MDVTLIDYQNLRTVKFRTLFQTLNFGEKLIFWIILDKCFRQNIAKFPLFSLTLALLSRFGIDFMSVTANDIHQKIVCHLDIFSQGQNIPKYGRKCQQVYFVLKTHLLMLIDTLVDYEYLLFHEKIYWHLIGSFSAGFFDPNMIKKCPKIQNNLDYL